MKSIPIGHIPLGENARLSLGIISEGTETDVIIVSEARVWQTVGTMSVPMSNIGDLIAQLERLRSGIAVQQITNKLVKASQQRRDLNET